MVIPLDKMAERYARAELEPDRQQPFPKRRDSGCGRLFFIGLA